MYLIEVAIAASLILGVFTRAGAALGALMAINLWLGLYNAPGEWPWTYMFLVVIQLLFVIDPPGRSLGTDALLWRRKTASRKGRRSSLLSLERRSDANFDQFQTISERLSLNLPGGSR